jgi:nickel transport system permease protein
MTAVRPRFRRRPRPGAVLGLALIGLLAALAVAAPLLAPHDPTLIDLGRRLEGASAAHWLGTDHLGRDILSRLIHGATVSLGAGALILSLILALGIAVGGAAGLLGGRVDQVLMRLCDVFLTFPTFVLALFMIGVLGTGLANVVIAVVLSHWAWYARIVRGLVLSMREADFVTAARVAGASRARIFAEHILPGAAGQLAVLASLDFGHMVLHVAGLSFLGLGVPAPTPEWGVMIGDAREFVWTQPMLLVWPGMMILLTVMGFNLLGDALRDRLDPSLAARGH